MASLVICDDEAHIVDILGRFFSQKGHEVFATASGREAIARASSAPVDAIITDIAMEGVGGLDILRAVKEKGLDIPVIVTTGNPSHQSAVAALKEGAFDHLVKPFHLEEIAARLDRALAAKIIREQNALYSKLVSLHSISRLLEGCATPEAVRTRALKSAAKLGRAAGAWWWAPDRPPEAGEGSTKADPAALAAGLEGLAARAAETGGPRQEPPPPGLVNHFSWWMAAPVGTRGRAYGALALARAPGQAAFDDTDLEVFGHLSAILALNLRSLEAGAGPGAPAPMAPGLAALFRQAVDAHCRGYESKAAAVDALGREIGAALGWARGRETEWLAASALYDLGKLKVPQSVLAKPRKLSGPERAGFRDLYRWAAARARQVDGWEDFARVVEDVGEWWDGTGPGARAGVAIDPLARALAAADAFCAMRAARPYRPALGPAEALAEMRAGAGKRFDPAAVEVLCKLRPAPDTPPAG